MCVCCASFVLNLAYLRFVLNFYFGCARSSNLVAFSFFYLFFPFFTQALFIFFLFSLCFLFTLFFFLALSFFIGVYHFFFSPGGGFFPLLFAFSFLFAFN